MNDSNTRRFVSGASLLFLAIACPVVSRADTRIVAEVTSGAGSAKRTVTILLRDGQIRRESGDGNVVLADRSAGKVWGINQAAHSFWSQTLTDYRNGMANNGSEPLQTSVKLGVVKPDAPDKAASPSLVSPTDAMQWSLSGTAARAPRPMSVGGGGGFGRGGGGFPGGGMGRRGGRSGGGSSPESGGSFPSGGSRLPLLTMAGQAWTGSWESLTDVPDKAMRDLTLLLTEEALPAGSPLRGALQGQLAKNKALLLASTITLNRAARTQAPTTGGADPIAQSVATFTVVSIEKGLTLDRGLFQIPAGFTEAPRVATQ